MKNRFSSKLLLAAALCSFAVLGACTENGSDTLKHSSGTPVNPEADPGGQGIPGSRATGANPQGTKGTQ